MQQIQTVQMLFHSHLISNRTKYIYFIVFITYFGEYLSKKKTIVVVNLVKSESSANDVALELFELAAYGSKWWISK